MSVATSSSAPHLPPDPRPPRRSSPAPRPRLAPRPRPHRALVARGAGPQRGLAARPAGGERPLAHPGGPRPHRPRLPRRLIAMEDARFCAASRRRSRSRSRGRRRATCAAGRIALRRLDPDHAARPAAGAAPPHPGRQGDRGRCAPLQLEARFSKREILAAYLTLAPYGGTLEGVRAASSPISATSPPASPTASRPC